MARVKIQGAIYEMRYDLSTIETIEKTYGSLEEMKAALKNTSVGNVRMMFQIMVNTARDYKKQPPMTDEEAAEALKHATIWEIKLLNRTIQDAMQEAMKSETTGGNEADDEEVDEVLEELNRKNGKAGDQPGRESTTDTL